jgi:hypothetical protein
MVTPIKFIKLKDLAPKVCKNYSTDLTIEFLNEYPWVMSFQSKDFFVNIYKK